jgi:hypothetical protein
MAEPATEKKRKSVAFSDGATLVDENGAVTETPTSDTTSAQAHTAADTNGGVDEITVRFIAFLDLWSFEIVAREFY